MKKVYSLIIALLVTLGIFLFPACESDLHIGTGSNSNSSGTQNTPTKPIEPEKPTAKLTVDNSSLDYEVEYIAGYYYITITGTALNTYNKTISYAQVTFSIFDSSGAQIGNALDNISNLAANTPWKFSALGVLDSTPSSFRLAEITVF